MREMFKWTFCDQVKVLRRVDVDGCSSTLWATVAMFSVDFTGRALYVNELLYPIRIQFAEFASQIDPQTTLKAFLFYQIWKLTILEVNFQYFPILYKRSIS